MKTAPFLPDKSAWISEDECSKTLATFQLTCDDVRTVIEEMETNKPTGAEESTRRLRQSTTMGHRKRNEN